MGGRVRTQIIITQFDKGLNKDIRSKKTLVSLDSHFIEFGFCAASVYK